jgi:flagellin-like protein
LQVKDSLTDFSHEKKGMSPLIATMLLIAFAVALGAMIMNLPFFDTEKIPSGPDCSRVNLELYPYLCYADNMIKISVRNTGEVIDGLTLKWVDDAGPGQREIPGSQLGTDAILKKDIPFPKTGKTSISLVPSMTYKGQLTPCPEPALQFEEVPNC